MTSVADVEDEPPKSGKKGPLLIGLVLALAGGGGGFYAVSSGMIMGGGSASNADDGHAADSKGADDHGDDDHGKAADDGHGDSHGEAVGSIAFVPLDPLVISLPPGSGHRHLRFSAQLEVDPRHVGDVTTIKPRIADVMNTYLRAVDAKDFEDPSVLLRLRAQLLRRLQIVAEEGHVRDLLIMEFVLN